jgi:hypothetical protein
LVLCFAFLDSQEWKTEPVLLSVKGLMRDFWLFLLGFLIGIGLRLFCFGFCCGFFHVDLHHSSMWNLPNSHSWLNIFLFLFRHVHKASFMVYPAVNLSACSMPGVLGHENNFLVRLYLLTTIFTTHGLTSRLSLPSPPHTE